MVAGFCRRYFVPTRFCTISLCVGWTTGIGSVISAVVVCERETRCGAGVDVWHWVIWCWRVMGICQFASLRQYAYGTGRWYNGCICLDTVLLFCCGRVLPSRLATPADGVASHRLDAGGVGTYGMAARLVVRWFSLDVSWLQSARHTSGGFCTPRWRIRC